MCTDSGLEPAQLGQAQVFDNELHLSGEVCLTPPADASFPVKILFLVDTSDSMSVTDRGATRAKAIAKVMDRYAAHPAVRFGVIAFDSSIDPLTKGFTSRPDTGAIGTRLSAADSLTDYQGALAAAYKMISEDILSSSPAERARSKYVVVFFSDGAPDPQCSSQTTPCGATQCPPHQHCRATVCKDDYLICTVARQDWETAFTRPPSMTASQSLADLYPELQRGADYNLPSQILRSVDDLMGLQEFYHVGEIRLHTAFLYDPEAASDPLARPFGLDREGGVALMTAMAEHGLGTFTEFDNASKVDFLNINYTAFKEENGLAMLLATNLDVIDTGAGLQSDTDGDGLADEAEAGQTCVAKGTALCTDSTDTDGDGYTDLFEERNRISGFDPNDPQKPITPCTRKNDTDHDLLRDCEEEFLKTEPSEPDTDGDRIPDGLEFRARMDSLSRSDVYDDPDRDGVRNIDEVKAHTNPVVAFSPSHPVPRYLYDVAPITRADGRQCYAFDVRHIALLTTGKGTEARLGVNRVLLYFGEAPLDRALDPGLIRIACVDVRYVDGALKSPPGGRVSFTDADFHAARESDPDPSRRALEFDPSKHCKDRTADVVVPDAGPAARKDGAP